jgi:hypothetical protein
MLIQLQAILVLLQSTHMIGQLQATLLARQLFKPHSCPSLTRVQALHVHRCFTRSPAVSSKTLGSRWLADAQPARCQPSNLNEGWTPTLSRLWRLEKKDIGLKQKKKKIIDETQPRVVPLRRRGCSEGRHAVKRRKTLHTLKKKKNGQKKKKKKKKKNSPGPGCFFGFFGAEVGCSGRARRRPVPRRQKKEAARRRVRTAFVPSSRQSLDLASLAPVALAGAPAAGLLRGIRAPARTRSGVSTRPAGTARSERASPCRCGTPSPHPHFSSFFFFFLWSFFFFFLEILHPHQSNSSLSPSAAAGAPPAVELPSSDRSKSPIPLPIITLRARAASCAGPDSLRDAV